MKQIKKRVYRFGGKTAEGDGKMRELLGGKGANLAEMNLLGMPVPAGFTITTECCTEYYRLGGGYTPELKAEVAELMQRGLDLKAAANEACGRAAGEIVLFDQKRLFPGQLALQRRGHAGVACAHDHDVIFGHIGSLIVSQIA